MPHHIGPNVKMCKVTRNVIEDFSRCPDRRAWEAACLDQPNDSWLEVCVSKPSADEDREYLRRWLIDNGWASESEEYVILGISW